MRVHAAADNAAGDAVLTCGTGRPNGHLVIIPVATPEFCVAGLSDRRVP